ncbi:uncharacterized protein [Lolium perenne]|uniref:uncharacterized protein n=1 Tax=Lolium perenne TaxID=4522 RepID=UPI0021F5804A|nr:uncharacterized protein LOC127326763 [Lolium perenne]
MAIESGVPPSLRSPLNFSSSQKQLHRRRPIPPLLPELVFSIPPVEQPVSGEICGGPHEPVHVRVEEKGGSSRKTMQEWQLAMVEGREFEYPAMMTDDEIARLGVLVSEVDRPVQPPLPRYATGIMPPGLTCMHYYCQILPRVP